MIQRNCRLIIRWHYNVNIWGSSCCETANKDYTKSAANLKCWKCLYLSLTPLNILFATTSITGPGRPQTIMLWKKWNNVIETTGLYIKSLWLQEHIIHRMANMSPLTKQQITKAVLQEWAAWPYLNKFPHCGHVKRLILFSIIRLRADRVQKKG